MSYHPKLVAEWGTAHNYDLSSAEDRKELAEEYIAQHLAPSGMVASIIEWHLTEYVAGRSVGVYEPDGTKQDWQPGVIARAGFTRAELDYLARCVDLGRSDPEASAILQPTERDELLRKLGGRRS